MGEFGGPVFPYTALGGFLNGTEILGGAPPYKDASALIIAMPVNNYYRENETEKALAWEKQ